MTNTPTQEDIFISTFEVSPSQAEYCICVHFIKVTVQRRGAPPRGETGSAAAFIIITSATTEICYLRLTDAAQTNVVRQVGEEGGEMETIEGDCERKAGSEGERANGERVERGYAFVLACVPVLVPRSTAACLHMFSCVYNVCFCIFCSYANIKASCTAGITITLREGKGGRGGGLGGPQPD